MTDEASSRPATSGFAVSQQPAADVAAPQAPEPGRRRHIVLVAVRLLLVLAAVAVVSVIAERAFDISVDDINDAIDAAGVLAPIIYVVVLFFGLSVPFNPVSDLATVNVAALVFPPTVSIAATFAAHTMALVVNYTVGRHYGATLLRRVASQRGAATIESLGQNFSYRALFLFRLALPLTAIGIDFVSYFSGMRRLPFWRFYVVSIVPWTALSVVFFTSTSLLKEQSIVLFFLPAAVLILVPSLILLLRRRFRRS